MGTSHVESIMSAGEMKSTAMTSDNGGNFFRFYPLIQLILLSRYFLWDTRFTVQSLSCVLLFATPWTAYSTPGLPVHHQLPEFTQTHIHWVSDTIKPSHPLSSPSPPAPNPSQHQSFPMSQLFAWGGQSTGVSASASFLPKNTQDWSPLERTVLFSILNMRH